MNDLEVTSQAIDFYELYDQYSEYMASRVEDSFEQTRVLLEATAFKIPNLLGLLLENKVFESALEIGCATGELIENFPVVSGGRRIGCEISSVNVQAALNRFYEVEFFARDFAGMLELHFEAVVLSDVLEHVEDDAGFLRLVAERGQYTLANLPLEDNWLNDRRACGPNDASGHLSRYSLQQGFDLFRRAGMTVLNHRQIWIHETESAVMCRTLRGEHFSHDFSGSMSVRLLKQSIFNVTRTIKPLGRRLFASNLFALAVKEIV